MLRVNDLVVRYGMIEAIKGISFEVDDGQIVTLIGANGAGKTTTMHTISGLLKPYSGEILLDDKDITKLPAHKIVELGIAQCPERRRIFSSQSVEDNLLLGAYTRKDKEEIQKDLANVYELFPHLKDRTQQLAGTLSGGEQQMLAMGRALMAKPKIMLLDEPSMGLSPLLVKEIFAIIKDINKQGVTILLVEQNARMALGIADKAYVIETGRIVMSGTGQELLESPDIRKAYLGG
ncbi:MAG: ABC transporter ATP-binding protein [Erysipelotrichaceae bacterium]|nr:ABC transporter ATP-binding protein [Erysipelotrichaceae bacterium]